MDRKVRLALMNVYMVKYQSGPNNLLKNIKHRKVKPGQNDHVVMFNRMAEAYHIKIIWRKKKTIAC